ncbi:MAG: aminotransferase class IV family protein [Candidatus Marinimicrobia bacterium]|nr:aminotransferase class IV family protein [Candidatus Neomarinimicrobiota bacterium]
MIKALINNQWESIPEENLQLGATTFSYETGLYETFRTLDFKPVFLQAHLNRLFKSAQKINLNISYSQSSILEMLLKVIHDFPDPNQRVRILAVPNKLILYTSHLNLDSIIYDGVSVMTVKAFRDNPELKTTQYHACLNAWKTANDAGCFEAILMDEDGLLFEGSRSNLFWVINGIIFTRKGDVLPGITRQTIINQSPFPIDYGLLNISEIRNIDECFLTNSGSGIIPVRQINDELIGNGTIGPITKQLLPIYHQWMVQDLKGDSI